MALKHSNPTRYRIDRQGKKQWARAPYNFVPLPEKMVAARTPLDHDLYHEKGLTGWIDCELETCSPTYVRGMLTRTQYDSFGQKSPDELTIEEKVQMAPFFSTEASNANALPTIPGSTLRGMIRALVEIVGYGRMRWVTPSPTFTFRAVAASKDDPLREPYREALGAFGNKVKAGYLEQKGDKWFVRPAITPEAEGWPPEAAYLKIKEEHIDGKAIPGFRRFNSSNYEPNWFEVCFEAEVRRGKRGPYVAILEIGSRDKGYKYKGILTCSGNMLETGKENQKSPRKKHALVLPLKDDRSQPLEIPEQAIRDYRDGMTPFQKEKLGAWGGKDWGCLKDGAPVFYVAEGNEVLYFGHSPNFRIPMRLSVFEPKQRQPYLKKQKDKPLTRAATPLDFVPEALRNDQRPDLAEAIFGWVEEKDGGPKEQRAGRVFFSDARYIGYVGPLDSFWLNPEPIAPHTLSSPKPTTFQHYLVQDRSAMHNPDEKPSLAHYGTSPLETQIRGHKGYWHKGMTPDLQATEKERGHEKQLTRIMPLRPGVRFSCRIYFENLREEELGALWWALILPGDSEKTYRHKLGMGKSLGMGAVTITPRLHLTDRTARYNKLFNATGWEEATSEAEAQPYLAAFEKFVLSELGLARNLSRLAQVERIQALLALLSWPGPDPSQTRYMEIEHPENENEYKERPVLPDSITVLAGATFLDRAIDPAPPIQPSKNNLPADYVEGIVKKFGLGANQDFGFIQPIGGGKDVFVHKNQLANGTKTLKTGDRVRFKVIKGVKGLQAQDVSLIE